MPFKGLVMKMTNIERLKEMIRLEEKRVALERDMDRVVTRLNELKDQITSGSGAAAASIIHAIAPRVRAGAAGSITNTRRRRAARRGGLTEKLLSALQQAGESGITVRELADQLGAKAANVYAWFYSTAKRMPGVKKIGEARYRFEGADNGETTPRAATKRATATKPARAAKAARAGKLPSGGKRGALTEAIMKQLRAAGDKGMSVRELSGKLNANYKNLSVWFSTTGKKNPSIQKAGPATYKLAAGA